MNNLILKKFISLLTAVFFCFSSLTANVNAAIISNTATPLDNNTFDSSNFFSIIPMSQGKITSLVNSQSDTLIVNIQDLHSHADTQRNISKIIDSIASKYNVSGVYTEGGYGKIDVSWIDAVKDAELKNKIIEQLLDNGDLTASEYYTMTFKNPVIVKGIEDKQIHIENIKRLADIENNKAAYEEIIDKTNKEIGILNKFYTNGRNIRFNRILSKYDNKKISDSKLYLLLEKYVSAINENPSNYNNTTRITLDNYPNIQFYLSMIKSSKKIDDKRAAMELQSLIGILKSNISYSQYKQLADDTNNFQDSERVIEFVSSFLKANPDIAANYVNLNKLAAINELTKMLNPVDLLSEQRLLIEKIKFVLSYDNTEAEISFITDFKKYFADFLTASLTQDDWLYVKENLNLFLSIYAKYAAYDNLKELEVDFAELTKYYDINTERNKIFLSNILDKPAKSAPEEAEVYAVNVSDILSNARDIKIVITGGYHSEGLKELLSQKGISSIVITPNVTTDISKAQAKYTELIKEQAKFPSEALAYILMSNTPDINQTVKILKAAYALGLNGAQIQTEIIDKSGLTNISVEGGNIVIINNGSREEIPLNGIQNIDFKNIEKSIAGIPGLALNEIGNLFDLQSLQNPLAALNNIEYEILKQISLLLFNAEIYFENGSVSEIENEGYFGKSLNGIPADTYERFLPFMQRLMLRKEMGKSLFSGTEYKQNEEASDYNGSYFSDKNASDIFDGKKLDYYPVKPLLDNVREWLAGLAKTQRKRIKLKLNDGEIMSAVGVIEEAPFPAYHTLFDVPKAYFDIEYKNGKYAVINTLYIARDQIQITPAEDGYFYIETPYADTRFSLPMLGSKGKTDEKLVVDAEAVSNRIRSKSETLPGEISKKQLSEKDFNGRKFSKIAGFTTFSGTTKGVENNKDINDRIRQYLSELIESDGKENILVVCGATDFGGVHNVYNIAQELGLATMGLVALAGLKECPADIRKCDYYYVEDEIVPWEGAEAGDWGSESDKFVDLIDELYAFGGGPQAIQEIKNVNKQNKPVRVIFGINTTFSTKGQAEMSLINAGEQGRLDSLIESIQRKIDAEDNESRKKTLLKELKEAQKALGFTAEDINSINFENKKSQFKEFSFKQGEIAVFEADFLNQYPSVRFNVELIGGKYTITDLKYNNVVKKNISIINTPNGFYIDSDYDDLRLYEIQATTQIQSESIISQTEEEKQPKVIATQTESAAAKDMETDSHIKKSIELLQYALQASERARANANNSDSVTAIKTNITIVIQQLLNLLQKSEVESPEIKKAIELLQYALQASEAARNKANNSNLISVVKTNTNMAIRILTKEMSYTDMSLTADSTMNYYKNTGSGQKAVAKARKTKEGGKIAEEGRQNGLSEEEIDNRIIIEILAPKYEARTIAKIAEAAALGRITAEQILSGDFAPSSLVGKFLRKHSGYLTGTEYAQKRYREGLVYIITHTLEAANHSTIIKELARASIAPHKKWNKENPQTPLFTDTENIASLLKLLLNESSKESTFELFNYIQNKGFAINAKSIRLVHKINQGEIKKEWLEKNIDLYKQIIGSDSVSSAGIDYISFVNPDMLKSFIIDYSFPVTDSALKLLYYLDERNFDNNLRTYAGVYKKLAEAQEIPHDNLLVVRRWLPYLKNIIEEIPDTKVDVRIAILGALLALNEQRIGNLDGEAKTGDFLYNFKGYAPLYMYMIDNGLVQIRFVYDMLARRYDNLPKIYTHLNDLAREEDKLRKEGKTISGNTQYIDKLMRLAQEEAEEMAQRDKIQDAATVKEDTSAASEEATDSPYDTYQYPSGTSGEEFFHISLPLPARVMEKFFGFIKRNDIKTAYQHMDMDDVAKDIAQKAQILIHEILPDNGKALSSIGSIKILPDLYKVIAYIDNMINSYRKINKNGAEEIRQSLDEFTAKATMIYIRHGELFDEAITGAGRLELVKGLNALINRVHQASEQEVKNYVLNNSGIMQAPSVTYTSKLHNLKAYILSNDRSMDRKIIRLFEELANRGYDGGLDTDDFIVVNDTLFWSKAIGNTHTANVIAHFGETDRGVSLTFTDFHASQALGKSRTYRLTKVLENLGFEVKTDVDADMGMIVITANLNKDSGLNEDRDIIPVIARAVSMIMRTSSRTPEFYSDFTAPDSVDNTINALVQNEGLSHMQIDMRAIADKLNEKLKVLGLAEIPTEAPVNRKLIREYFDEQIERALADGKIMVNSKGRLIKNNKFNPLRREIARDFTSDNGIVFAEQGAIINQIIDKRDFKFKEIGVVGEYTAETGHLKLSDGNLLSVKLIRSKWGNIKAAKAVLIDENGKRNPLTNKDLADILRKEGIHYVAEEKIGQREYEVIKDFMKESEKNRIETPSSRGLIISSVNGEFVSGNLIIDTSKDRTVLREMLNRDKNALKNVIWVVNYTTPDDEDLVDAVAGIVALGGGINSHCSIITREYGKPSIVLNGTRILANGDLEIAYSQTTGSPRNINGVQAIASVSKKAVLKNGESVGLDTKRGALILTDHSAGSAAEAEIFSQLKNYIASDNYSLIVKTIKRHSEDKILLQKIIEYIYFQSADPDLFHNLKTDLQGMKPLLTFLQNEYVYAETSGSSEEIAAQPAAPAAAAITNTPIKSLKLENVIKRFTDIKDVDETEKEFGSKNAKLADMFSLDLPGGVIVPDGFITSTDALRYLLKADPKKLEAFDRLNKRRAAAIHRKNLKTANALNKEIRDLISGAENPEFMQYLNSFIDPNKEYAIRSSGIGEDGKNYSFAGMGVSKTKQPAARVFESMKECWMSFYSERATGYMAENGMVVMPAVLVNEWIDFDVSFVAMSHGDKIIVNITYGECEGIVGGSVPSDYAVIDKNTGEILLYESLPKDYMIRTDENGVAMKKLVPYGQQNHRALNFYNDIDARAKTIADLLAYIKETRGYEVDSEGGFSGGKCYLVQERPVTNFDDISIPAEALQPAAAETQTPSLQDSVEELTKLAAKYEGGRIVANDKLIVTINQIISALDYGKYDEKIIAQASSTIMTLLRRGSSETERINSLNNLNDQVRNIDASSLTLPWWFLPVSLPRAVILGTVLLLFAPIRFITGKTLDMNKLKATITSIVEIPWTILLPAKIFVLLHFKSEDKKIIKDFFDRITQDISGWRERNRVIKSFVNIAAQDKADIVDQEIFQNYKEERLIRSFSKRMEGTEKIKRETLKWLFIGAALTFAMLFLIEYTDRHVITTRPFGDLLGMSDLEAAKIVFKSVIDSLLNNEITRNISILYSAAIAAIANAVTHWKHNLNPENIRAIAKLDLSESGDTTYHAQTDVTKVPEIIANTNKSIDKITERFEDEKSKFNVLEYPPVFQKESKYRVENIISSLNAIKETDIPEQKFELLLSLIDSLNRLSGLVKQNNFVGSIDFWKDVLHSFDSSYSLRNVIIEVALAAYIEDKQKGLSLMKELYHQFIGNLYTYSSSMLAAKDSTKQDITSKDEADALMPKQWRAVISPEEYGSFFSSMGLYYLALDFEQHNYSADYWEILENLPQQYKTSKSETEFNVEEKDNLSETEGFKKFDYYLSVIKTNMLALAELRDGKLLNAVFRLREMIEALRMLNEEHANAAEQALSKIEAELKKGISQDTIAKHQEISQWYKESISDITELNTLINAVHQTAVLDFTAARENKDDTHSDARKIIVKEGDKIKLKAFDYSDKLDDRNLEFLSALSSIMSLGQTPIIMKNGIFIYSWFIGQHSVDVLIDINSPEGGVKVSFNDISRIDGSRLRVVYLASLFARYMNLTITNYENRRADKTIKVAPSFQAEYSAENVNDLINEYAKIFHLITKILSSSNWNDGLLENDYNPRRYKGEPLKKYINKLYVPDLSISDFANMKDPDKKMPESFLKVMNDNFSFEYVWNENVKNVEKLLSENVAELDREIYEYLGIEGKLRNPSEITGRLVEGRIRVNPISGILEINPSYNPGLSILSAVNNNETQAFSAGAIVDNMPFDKFNFKTEAFKGNLNALSGMLRLKTKKGYLSVKAFARKNSEDIQFAFCEFVDLEGKRDPLTAEELTKLLIAEGNIIKRNLNLSEKAIKQHSEFIQAMSELSEDSVMQDENIKEIEGIPVSSGDGGYKAVKVTYDKKKADKNSVLIMEQMRPGEDTEPIEKAGAIMLTKGGTTSHASIVSREKRTPAVLVSGKWKNGKFVITYNAPVKNKKPNNGIIETEEIEIVLEEGQTLSIDAATGSIILEDVNLLKIDNSVKVLKIIETDIANARRIKNRDMYTAFNLILKAQKQILDLPESDKKLRYMKELSDLQAGFGAEVIKQAKKFKQNAQKIIRKQKTGKITDSDIEKAKIMSGKAKFWNYFFNHNGIEHIVNDLDKIVSSAENTKSSILKVKDMAHGVKSDFGAKTDGVRSISKLLEGIKGVKVLDGIGVAKTAIYEFFENDNAMLNDFKDKIEKFKNAVEEGNKEKIYELGAAIAALIDAHDNQAFKGRIEEFLSDLNYAVRSSGIGEDGNKYSFAGRAASELNVPKDDVYEKFKVVLASFFSPASLEYMYSSKIFVEPAALILEMLNPEISGTIITDDTGNKIIDAAHGLGEGVVQGIVATDRITAGSINIYRKARASERITKIVSRGKEGGTISSLLNENEKSGRVLSDELVNTLINVYGVLENYFGYPVDIEYAIVNGYVYVLQVRPITAFVMDYDINELESIQAARQEYQNIKDILAGLFAKIAGYAAAKALYLFAASLFKTSDSAQATAVFMEDSVQNADAIKNMQLSDNTALFVINNTVSKGTPTGLKVNGRQIYMQTKEYTAEINGKSKLRKYVVFSANGVETQNIIKTLQLSETLNKAVEDVTEVKGKYISIDSIVVNENNKNIKEFDGDIINVGYEDFRNGMESGINEYIASLTEEKRIGRAAQAELQLISLINSNEKRVEDILNDTVNQSEYSAKRIVVEDNGFAHNALKSALKNNNKTMSDLHSLGIEVYIIGNRSGIEYAKEGFSGIINNESLYDLYTGEFIKIRQAKSAQDLKTRFDGYTIIELDTLVEIFNTARNKIGDAFEWLSGFFNISLDGIGINEAVKRAYNMKLENLPEAKTISDANKAIDKMSLEILKNPNISQDVKTAYRNALTEMILAANYIKNKGNALKDERMVRTLGKMLVLREELANEGYATDQTIDIDAFQKSLGHALKNENIIGFAQENVLSEKAKGTEKAKNVNSVIEMIDYYGFDIIDSLKNKRDPKKEYTMSGMKAMLAAA